MIRCTTCHALSGDEWAGQPCIQCGTTLPKVHAENSADNPFDKFRVFVPSQPSGSEADEGKRHEWPKERERNAAVQEEDKEDAPLDPNHLGAITEYGRARTIVSVIGFANSGKTFFVNRLRDLLAKEGWKRSPEPARQISLSPEGIELSSFVPTGIRLRKGQNYSYIMVDCAGESFRQALESQFKPASLAGVQGRSYLAAVAFGSAYVLVIRAEDLLGLSVESDDGYSIKERNQFIEDMVQGFDDIISAIVVSKERLRTESLEQFLRQGLSLDDLKGVQERNRVRCTQPLCIALSMADRLAWFSDDDYDADPFLFTLNHAPTLVKAVDRSFENFRFDFLSAFYGHDADDRPDYRKPTYGVQDSFLWLHDMLRPRSLISRIGRFASGHVPTRHLVALRRRVDPVFDQAWRAT